jgi:hypothetical protein
MSRRKVLITGAAGMVGTQILPGLRERYDLVVVGHSNTVDYDGNPLEDIQLVDLVDPDRSKYAHLFEGVDAVVHMGHMLGSGEPIDRFLVEKANVEMGYNVLRASYEAGVRRMVFGTSNHAADWYEHNLIHTREMDVVEPYTYPLSDNFYGWAKISLEAMGFLFACGLPSFQDASGKEHHLSSPNAGRKMGVIMVRIGHPRELVPANYGNDPAVFKRVLGCYVSARDMTQLVVKAIEKPDIDNEHGIPWHVVYCISDNTRAFWSIASARRVLDYQPEDDSEVRFADHIRGFIAGAGATAGPGRVGPS